MNFIDILIGIVLLLGFYSGFKKGLILELTSLLGLILGIFGAFYITKYHGLYIGEWLDWKDEFLKITTFLLSFIIIVIIMSLIGKLITKLMDVVALGLVNKLCGGLFGMLKTALVLSVIILLFNLINSEIKLVNQQTLEASYGYTYLNGFAEIVWLKLIDMSQEHQDVIDKIPDLNLNTIY